MFSGAKKIISTTVSSYDESSRPAALPHWVAKNGTRVAAAATEVSVLTNKNKKVPNFGRKVVCRTV